MFVNFDERTAAILDGKWKYFKHKGQKLLFDLSTDSNELNNVSADHLEIVARLMKAVRQFRELSAAFRIDMEMHESRTSLNEEERRQLEQHLKALGYSH